MAGRGQPVGADQQAEPRVQAIQQLGQAERIDPGRGQLQGQRQPVQPAHQLRDQGTRFAVQPESRIGLPGAVAEQRHRLRPIGLMARLGHRQRGQPVAGLTGQPDRLPAGGQDPYVVGGRQQRPAQFGHGRDDLLAVVQHDQQLLPGQGRGQRVGHRNPRPVGHTQSRGHRRRYPARVGDGGQLGQPDSIRVAGGHLPRHLAHQTGLAHAAGTEHGHQAAGAEQVRDVTDRPGPAHETGQRRGETMHVRPCAGTVRPH